MRRETIKGLKEQLKQRDHAFGKLREELEDVKIRLDTEQMARANDGVEMQRVVADTMRRVQSIEAGAASLEKSVRSLSKQLMLATNTVKAQAAMLASISMVG